MDTATWVVVSLAAVALAALAWQFFTAPDEPGPDDIRDLPMTDAWWRR